MIKSSQTISKGSPVLLPPPTPHTLRKAQSVHSINSATSPQVAQKPLTDERDVARHSPVHTTRGKSVDAPRSPRAATEPPKSAKEKNKKDKEKETALSPQRYCNLLMATSSTQLDIEIVKKLRLMLRNESARYAFPTGSELCAL
jgi:hypothetical protein